MKTIGKIDRNLLLSLIMLVGLLVAGAVLVNGFLSADNLRSMLLLSAFLGLASIGQTFSALLGGLDLSIPYLIGSANIGLLYLLNSGTPDVLAVVIVLALGLLVGLLNGLLSFRLQNQSLIVTLGMGFAVVGGTQIVKSLGASDSGAAGGVPTWLTNIGSLSGTSFGLPLPPIVLIWVVIAAAIIFLMQRTWFGRSIYALGGNRPAARLMLISERQRWVSVYVLSGFFSAATGIVLLGFSGGAFVRVGDPYLFLTVAAVAVGGTSLLGGRGGYLSTVLGTFVLIALTSLLVGLGLENNAQQFILGLLIVPLVGLYARKPHLRYQI